MDDPRSLAIAHITECRDIHKSWFEWQRDDEDWENSDLTLDETAGGPEWHQSWIEKYDLVLAVLKGELA